MQCTIDFIKFKIKILCFNLSTVKKKKITIWFKIQFILLSFVVLFISINKYIDSYSESPQKQLHVSQLTKINVFIAKNELANIFFSERLMNQISQNPSFFDII